MSKLGNTIEWKVPLSDRLHIVRFEHGTTSGRRIIYVDDQIVKREDFMFKLVGTEYFKIGSSSCTLEIIPKPDFSYIYQLSVNGKRLEDFVESQSKILKCWIVKLNDKHRIILEKDTLEITLDGKVLDTTGEFTDNGTSTYFSIEGRDARIETFSSGNKHSGMMYQLFVEDVPITETSVDDMS